jgi:hypothetical protein
MAKILVFVRELPGKNIGHGKWPPGTLSEGDQKFSFCQFFLRKIHRKIVASGSDHSEDPL